MAPISNDTTNSNAIWTACQEISARNPSDFKEITRSRVTLDTSDCVSVADKIIRLFQRIDEADIDALPVSYRPTLVGAINDTEKAFDDFPQRDPAIERADDIKRDLEEIYTTNYTKLRDIIFLERATEGRAEDDSGVAQARLSELSAMRDEAQGLLETMKQATGEAGVKHHASVFKEAALENAQEKIKWLKRTAVLSLVTAMAVIIVGINGWLGQELGSIADRLIVFGILTYAVVLSARTYRAEAHNQVVNEHRQNALETFETFIAGTSDAATRNAVLVQATQCIFSHRPSGFGHQENDTPPPAHMLELTRSVMGKESAK